MASACGQSPIESKPVSGPISFRRRVLLFRRAPRCNCLVQPFSASRRPNSSIRLPAKRCCSAAVAGWPARARSKMAPASWSVANSPKAWFSPWSESRPPIWWKKSCRCRRASVNARKPSISILAAAARRSTQGLKTSGRCTVRALSGRNAGNTLVGSPEAAMALWHARSSVGSSVVQTALTWNLPRMPWARRPSVASSGVGLVPDARRARFVEQLVDAEVALQFEMRPVVERIA